MARISFNHSSDSVLNLYFPYTFLYFVSFFRMFFVGIQYFFSLGIKLSGNILNQILCLWSNAISYIFDLKEIVFFNTCTSIRVILNIGGKYYISKGLEFLLKYSGWKNYATRKKAMVVFVSQFWLQIWKYRFLCWFSFFCIALLHRNKYIRFRENMASEMNKKVVCISITMTKNWQVMC